ncbi:MAG TPA: hypothetical protein VFL57_20450 [Bryobacteraceae bacterium]|nr:hypothetical protein [Bryobacteraceae bacterium]
MNEKRASSDARGTQRKLTLALAAYAVIAFVAGTTLDGKLRIAIWILLAALAVKTWIASVSDANH